MRSFKGREILRMTTTGRRFRWITYPIPDLVIFQFQGRCHFKMGGSASKGEWQEALCILGKEKMELHLKEGRREVLSIRNWTYYAVFIINFPLHPKVIPNYGKNTTDVIRLTIKNEPKISRQISHSKGFRPHTAFGNGMLSKYYLSIFHIHNDSLEIVMVITSTREKALIRPIWFFSWLLKLCLLKFSLAQ